MDELPETLFQFLETMQNCRPQVSSSTVVLTNILGSARMGQKFSNQGGKRGFGFRLVIYMYFRGGFWMQDGGTINDKQRMRNLVHLLVLEDDSADTRIELPDTSSVGFLKKASLSA